MLAAITQRVTMSAFAEKATVVMALTVMVRCFDCIYERISYSMVFIQI